MAGGDSGSGYFLKWNGANNPLIAIDVGLDHENYVQDHWREMGINEEAFNELWEKRFKTNIKTDVLMLAIKSGWCRWRQFPNVTRIDAKDIQTLIRVSEKAFKENFSRRKPENEPVELWAIAQSAGAKARNYYLALQYLEKRSGGGVLGFASAETQKKAKEMKEKRLRLLKKRSLQN